MVFHKIPYFLQLFTKNLVKTLKHGSLHENLLVLAKSTSFNGFSQNPILFSKNFIWGIEYPFKFWFISLEGYPYLVSIIQFKGFVPK